MRPGQQNKRGRGRGNNNNNNNGGGGGNNNFNRKGGNPLTRTYDSSGPDVKIRGTAQHIAEKYAALARDAQSSGDRVMAENYLQHAEHYNRIIAAAQAHMQERFQRDERNPDYNNERDGDDVDGNDNDETTGSVAPQAQQVGNDDEQPSYDDGSGPQPVIEGTPLEVAVEEEAQAAEAPRAERQPRRRSTGPRQRRPRRTAENAEGGEGAAGENAGGEAAAEPAALEGAAE
ncbi:DUF4167 domain-containing protein [Agrobacterium sp.]|uniref:DUF4167 domain-containing protein n=1 Tax=Agrobacterium sp. TaxID=361 RepID=UPI0028B1A5D0|nr:DUF4167 domain-containing protein [Agrobacterium sp.]